MRAGRYSGSARLSPSKSLAGKIGSVAMVIDYVMSNNDAGRVDTTIRLAQRGNHAVAASLRRPQIHEQDLVLSVMIIPQSAAPQRARAVGLLIIADSAPRSRTRSVAVSWHSKMEYCKWSP